MPRPACRRRPPSVDGRPDGAGAWLARQGPEPRTRRADRRDDVCLRHSGRKGAGSGDPAPRPDRGALPAAARGRRALPAAASAGRPAGRIFLLAPIVGSARGRTRRSSRKPRLAESFRQFPLPAEVRGETPSLKCRLLLGHARVQAKPVGGALISLRREDSGKASHGRPEFTRPLCAGEMPHDPRGAGGRRPRPAGAAAPGIPADRRLPGGSGGASRLRPRRSRQDRPGSPRQNSAAPA
jgi:hypothetical protein